MALKKWDASQGGRNIGLWAEAAVAPAPSTPGFGGTGCRCAVGEAGGECAFWGECCAGRNSGKSCLKW